MYIGDTSHPNHLLYEIFDNSLDEANAGHANVIGVFIDTKKETCVVSDNGRGIPFQNDSIKTLATKLHSGGKFEKGAEGSAYGIAAGLHGIGLVAVTSLSDIVNITVFRDGKRASYTFEDSKLSEEDVTDWTENRPFGTQVTFKPSKRFFESVKFDIKPILQRMKLASIHINNLKLVLMVDGEKTIIDYDLDKYTKNNLLGEHAKDYTPFLDISTKVKDEELNVRLTWDLTTMSSTPKCTGCVNLLSVNEGTHINAVNNIIRNVFKEYAKKEKLTFQPNDCLQGLRVHTHISLYRPEYSSQTKEKLSTSKVKINHLLEGLDTKLKKALDDIPDTKLKLLNHFENYRKKQSLSKKIVTGSKEVSRFNNIIDSKLKDCTSHNVSDSELFITEGVSASGGLVQCRDPKIHAILGLKGKIPNMAYDKKDFLKNKEVVEIINCLGTGMEPHFHKDTLRYGKIIIAVDADEDGKHIATLLMVLFLKLTPELLKDERIYLSIMPLYGTTEKKIFKPFYSEESMKEYVVKNPNAKIQRYKGLGEMNPDQLFTCLLDPTTRKLETIKYPDDSKAIFELMTSAEKKREII